MKNHQTYQPARTHDAEMQEHLSKDLQAGCAVVIFAVLLIGRGLWWMLTHT